MSCGYFPDPDAALTAWSSRVGRQAAGACSFSPVDDRDLLFALLPTEMGIMFGGGENEAQLAEFHRAGRLADEVRATMPTQPADSARSKAAVQLDPAECAGLFAAWRAEHRPDSDRSPESDEVIAVLAQDWLSKAVPALRHTCSPHRVAYFAEHLEESYEGDFAERALALPPDWVAWFAGYAGLPADLAERCAPYASGVAHPAFDRDVGFLNMMACVEE